ncbi:MAG: hypothetical protein ACI9DC_004306 [Gammaproteobacteria bacterium]
MAEIVISADFNAVCEFAAPHARNAGLDFAHWTQESMDDPEAKAKHQQQSGDCAQTQHPSPLGAPAPAPAPALATVKAMATPAHRLAVPHFVVNRIALGACSYDRSIIIITHCESHAGGGGHLFTAPWRPVVLVVEFQFTQVERYTNR